MITDKLKDLVKEFEGCKLTIYLDMAKHKTVGFGHKDDTMILGATITQEKAEELLEQDLTAALNQTKPLVKVELTQNQLDALTDFAYNLGATRLKDSTLLKLVNSGDFTNVAAEFLRWDHAGGVTVPGLLRRRQAEVDLFFSDET